METEKVMVSEPSLLTPVWSYGSVGLVVCLLLTSEVKKSFGYTVSAAVGILLFLSGLAIMSNHYMKYLHMGGKQRLLMYTHFAPPPPDKKERLESALDKIVCKEGLSQLWMTEIQGKKKSLNILLTGATGYVGKAVLFQLLRYISKCPQEGKEKVDHKIYIMIRGKARKNLSAADRVAQLKENEIFAAYRDIWNEFVVAAESGDLQDKNCGMAEDSLSLLEKAEINVIVHCAADVNFNRPLKDSAGINISPSLQLMKLAKFWESCTRFVHVSTAFVNPECGSPGNPMPEQLYSLGKYDAEELYESMRGDQQLALEAKKEIGFQNNYVFTKCVGEHMMVKQKFSDLKIVRPAIVGPAWVAPSESWNGEKPSTISALMLLWGTRVVRVAIISRDPMPVIPVDVAANGIIHATIMKSKEEVKPSEPSYSVRNLIWSHESKRCFTNYRDMATVCLSLATLKHIFTGAETAISLFLVDTVHHFPFLYQIVHRIFNLGPLLLLQFVIFVLKNLGFHELEKLPVSKLFKFVDMLALYKPFMSRSFYFEGDIHVPEQMDIFRYIIMTAKATHQFWDSLFPGTIDNFFIVEFIPKGRWDFWWILCHARSGIKDCLYNFMLVRILRVLYSSAIARNITIVPSSLKMEALFDRYPREGNMIILAPTFKSEMDCAIAKHMCFCFPFMGWDVPTVFASKDFKDPSLAYKLRTIKNSFQVNATIVALLQEQRSSDGRLEMSSIDNLRALQESISAIGNHDYTIFPISIDYDQIPEFSLEFSRPQGLREIFSLYWSVCVMGKVQKKIGDLRLSFGKPLTLTPDSDLHEFAMNLRREQQAASVVTQYNSLLLAEKHLGIDKSSLEAALEQLNVAVLAAPNKGGAVGKVKLDRNIESPAEQWFIHFQWMQHFSSYLYESHPRWATWLGCGDVGVQSVSKTTEIEEALVGIRKVFDEMDSLAARAEASTREKTGDYASVTELISEINSLGNDKDTTIVRPIATAAAEFVVSNRLNGNVKFEGDEKKNEA